MKPTHVTHKAGTSRKFEVYPEGERYETHCLINDTTVSRAFPIKTFKTEGGAIRYGNRFLKAS